MLDGTLLRRWRSPGHRINPIIEEARERQRKRRVRLALVVLFIIAVAASYSHFRNRGGAAGPSEARASNAQAAEMPQAGGWNGGSARIASSSCPRCVQFDSWAATVPYGDPPNYFPHTTMAALGSQDAIINIARSWQPSEPAWALERHPLRILRSQIHANFEGNPTHGRVSLWLGTTWRGGSNVQVSVYFGSPNPSALTIARVQRELDSTKFAPWKLSR